MSIRQTLYRQSALIARQGAIQRAISSSAPRNGGHGESGHHHAESDDTETHETWFSRPKRNAFIVAIAGIVAWPFLPTPNYKPASPTLDYEAFQSLKADPQTPWITKQLARLIEDPKELRERNDQHIDESMRSASTRLLFDTAQRPEINVLKGKYVFDNASPHGVPVGSAVDMSSVRKL